MMDLFFFFVRWAINFMMNKNKSWRSVSQFLKNIGSYFRKDLVSFCRAGWLQRSSMRFRMACVDGYWINKAWSTSTTEREIFLLSDRDPMSPLNDLSEFLFCRVFFTRIQIFKRRVYRRQSQNPNNLDAITCANSPKSLNRKLDWISHFLRKKEKSIIGAGDDDFICLNGL